MKYKIGDVVTIVKVEGQPEKYLGKKVKIKSIIVDEKCDGNKYCYNIADMGKFDTWGDENLKKRLSKEDKVRIAYFRLTGIYKE